MINRLQCIGRRLSVPIICTVLINGGVVGNTAEITAPPAVPTVAKETNAIRQTGPALFEIGKIQLDQTRRTLRLPAVINLREGPVEYLLVTDYGKIHESLLRTEVAPLDVQVALLLLGAEKSEVPSAGSGTAANAPAIKSKDPARSSVTIEIAWTLKGRTRRFQAGDFIRDRRARTRVGKGQWAFIGSRFRNDGFAAQADGSIVSMIDDSDAVISNRRPGSDNDDNWLAAGQKLPPLDWPVEVIITAARK